MPRSKRGLKTFEVVRGYLVRTVELKDGRRYVHRCSLDAFREVAWFVEAHADEGVTTGMLWEGLPDVPCTQASVALEFMKERGCVRPASRRNYTASTFLFEDAMAEFHALAARCSPV